MTKLEKRAHFIVVSPPPYVDHVQKALEALRLTRVEAIEEALERFELAFERNEVVQDTLDAIRALIQEDE